MKGLAYTRTKIVASLDTKDYFVKQISHLPKGVVIAASVTVTAFCSYQVSIPWSFGKLLHSNLGSFEITKSQPLGKNCLNAYGEVKFGKLSVFRS